MENYVNIYEYVILFCNDRRIFDFLGNVKEKLVFLIFICWLSSVILGNDGLK